MGGCVFSAWLVSVLSEGAFSVAWVDSLSWFPLVGSRPVIAWVVWCCLFCQLWCCFLLSFLASCVVLAMLWFVSFCSSP